MAYILTTYSTYLEGGLSYNVEYSTVEPFSSAGGGNVPIWHRRENPAAYRSASREDLSEVSEATMKSFCAGMHKDLINDIAFLQVPQNMMITVGRDGTVNVWK